MASRVVEIARLWIGTPYVHQASCRGAGTDCLGLVRGVWRELGGAETISIPPYTADWSEAQGEERLLRGARHVLIEAAQGPVMEGQVLLFRMRERAVAKHLGIVGQGGDEPTFIHAFSGHHVVETALSAPWVRRIVARFDFPEGSI
ncbi:NlpC/P60 family putative phage cell wall peptidase [Palleronia aestuarii]|uniref:NlpC/P60 family putative phage cell wall peptidase n=1 Tax=Palleronia aestuarii TaxID=568105 RepID=A0A2W7NBA8_9RHOB|nr:NlpC/P60 family protein [Palleronia aestuarii]PZX17705.1 NlpC/P60 family putative phage cell wall peptidase [Palleronia aestuarii]